MKSDAPAYKTVPNALSVYQGGEEGQQLFEIFVPGFVFSSGVDVDGDGFDAGVDCNDNDPLVNPGATELCDGVDNNCNGEIDEGDVCPVKQVPLLTLPMLLTASAMLAAFGATLINRQR